MRTPPLRVLSPTSLDEAINALAGTSGARPIAGGLSLVPMLHRRDLRPAALVDLARVEGLAGVDVDGMRLAVGAMTTLESLRQAVAEDRSFRVVAEALASVGYRHVRRRSTVGGSLCHASAAGQVPLLAVALDALVTVHGRDSERAVPAADLLVGDGRTALDSGELVTAVTFTADPDLAYGFHQPLRAAGVAALVGVPSGTDAAATVTVAGAGQRPLRLPSAAALLRAGARPKTSELATAVAADLGPEVDAHTVQLAAVAVQRALTTERTDQ